MLFVRSLAGGISHSPREHTSNEDVEAAVDTLRVALTGSPRLRPTNQASMTDLAVTVPGEQDVIADTTVDVAWTLVEEFSTLVRDSGSEDERRAIDRITARLSDWDISHTLYGPELLVSLPLSAGLVVDGRTYAAKTPSMAAFTDDRGLTAPLTALASPARLPIDDELVGKVVLTRGFPASVPVRDLQRAGAVGVICISPGERIHEGICTSVWGSPDLTTIDLEPSIPVVAVSKPDGKSSWLWRKVARARRPWSRSTIRGGDRFRRWSPKSEERSSRSDLSSCTVT